MKVQIPVDMQAFSAMPIGGFFQTLSTKHTEFGICVSIDGSQRAAIIFPEQGPHRLQTGGVPTNVVYYPEAILRAQSFEFLRSDEFVIGSVIMAADGKSYIRVTDGGLGNYRTFDIETGLQKTLADDVPRILFADWKVGTIIDGEFAEIFVRKAPAQA
jgi:hypothetical protein